MTRVKHSSRRSPSGGDCAAGRPKWRGSRSVTPRGDASDPVISPEVKLLNISRAGVLLESPSRFFTGSHICLKLNAADAMFLLKGRVLRSKIMSPDSRTVKYESAVVFEDEFVLRDQDLAKGRRPQGKPARSRCARASEGSWIPAAEIYQLLGLETQQEGPIMTQAFLSNHSGADLRRILGLGPKVTS